MDGRKWWKIFVEDKEKREVEREGEEGESEEGERE